jgi:UDPglucose 6-dehydrogenase
MASKNLKLLGKRTQLPKKIREKPLLRGRLSYNNQFSSTLIVNIGQISGRDSATQTRSAMSPENAIQRISVFGLGKLGACIAAALASRGFQVVGYDVDKRKTEVVKKGLAPIEEPHLQETITQAGPRLKATDEIEEAVLGSGASFFVPSTPSLPDGSFSNHFLIPALESVAVAVRKLRRKRHLFVVNSTLTPGTSDSVLKPLLEKILVSECGRDFGLCYNPEFIALGDVLHGLLQPDFVLIGESDALSGALLEDVYKRFNTNSAPVERMSNVNAELAKISLNCAVTTKISFVNQLSGVCARIPGADAGVILGAIGKDRRIGRDYLKPGLGFGGPCFPRDNRLFQYVAQSVGADDALSRATDKINESVNLRLLETVVSLCPAGSPVGVLGLAYKPFTSVVDCSPGMWLCEQLTRAGRRVFAHDYFAGSNARSAFGNERLRICDDPMELVGNGCQLLVITCPWPGYKELFDLNESRFSRAIIVDPWSLLEPVVRRFKGVRYITALGLAEISVSSEFAARV